MATLSVRSVNTFETAASWGKYSPSPFLAEEEKWFYNDTELRGNQDVALPSVLELRGAVVKAYYYGRKHRLLQFWHLNYFEYSAATFSEIKLVII